MLTHTHTHTYTHTHTHTHSGPDHDCYPESNMRERLKNTYLLYTNMCHTTFQVFLTFCNFTHCKNSRVVLTPLWLSQLQNRYYCAAEVAIHAAKIHSLIHRHNYYARGTLCIRSWDSVYAHGTLCICFS